MMLKLFLLTALVAGLLDVSSARSLKLKLTADSSDDSIPVLPNKNISIKVELDQDGSPAIFYVFSNLSISGFSSLSIQGDLTTWSSDNVTVLSGTYHANLAFHSENTTIGIGDSNPIVDEPTTIYLRDTLIAITLIIDGNNDSATTIFANVISLPTDYESQDSENASFISSLISFVPTLKEKTDEKLVPYISDVIESFFATSNEEDTNNDDDLKSLVRSLKKQ